MHHYKKFVVVKYFSWALMVVFISGYSLLFWQYLEVKGMPHKPVAHYGAIAHIPLPAGFKRVPLQEGSFGAWLRKVPLKEDKTVYLYNGSLKTNQTAQFAVLDVSVGNRDLQQCADAVIRLYAEYLYSTHQYAKIAFHATDGTLMDYSSWMKGYRFPVKQGRLQKQLVLPPCEGQACFQQYLQTVFSYAGTLSLSKELVPVAASQDMKTGDVFIKGGSPGHAVIVMDMAVNTDGKKIFMLAQSYMPAQDIHVLQHPGSVTMPWYTVGEGGALLSTPEWVFNWKELKRFPDNH
jgi:hypothetical protein